MPRLAGDLHPSRLVAGTEPVDSFLSNAYEPPQPAREAAGLCIHRAHETCKCAQNTKRLANSDTSMYPTGQSPRDAGMTRCRQGRSDLKPLSRSQTVNPSSRQASNIARLIACLRVTPMWPLPNPASRPLLHPSRMERAGGYGVQRHGMEAKRPQNHHCPLPHTGRTSGVAPDTAERLRSGTAPRPQSAKFRFCGRNALRHWELRTP